MYAKFYPGRLRFGSTRAKNLFWIKTEHGTNEPTNQWISVACTCCASLHALKNKTPAWVLLCSWVGKIPQTHYGNPSCVDVFAGDFQSEIMRRRFQNSAVPCDLELCIYFLSENWGGGVIYTHVGNNSTKFEVSASFRPGLNGLEWDTQTDRRTDGPTAAFRNEEGCIIKPWKTFCEIHTVFTRLQVCIYPVLTVRIIWGTGVRGLTRGLATLPQGNQEPLVVRDKVGRAQVSLGWASQWNETLFPSVLWHCWLGDRSGIRPVKNWVLVFWWWWYNWIFARLIAAVVTTTSVILQWNAEFWYRLSPGCPGKWPLNEHCVVRKSLALKTLVSAAD